MAVPDWTAVGFRSGAPARLSSPRRPAVRQSADPVGSARRPVSRTLFLGSGDLRPRRLIPARRGTYPPCRYRPALAPWVRRRVVSGEFLPAVRGVTCGDINPDRLLGAFWVADEFRVALGACAAIRRCGPRIPRFRGEASPVHLGAILAHPCRWPPTPAVPAIVCCTRLICQGVGLRNQEPFPISPFTFVPDDGGKSTPEPRNHTEKRVRRKIV